MTSLLRLNPSQFVNTVVKNFSATSNKIHMAADRRSLISQIKDKKAKALAWETAGLPDGHEHYKRLYNECAASITSFANKYGLDPLDIENDMPIMYVLGQKAFPHETGKTTNIIAKAAALVLSAAFAFVTGGAVLGLAYRGFHLIAG